ncbi:MAG: hypothetical protein ACE5F5_00025 [Acidimicrobiia bacterium]
MEESLELWGYVVQGDYLSWHLFGWLAVSGSVSPDALEEYGKDLGDRLLEAQP